MTPPTNSQHRAGPIYFVLACMLYLIGSNYLDARGIVNLSILSLSIAFLIGLTCGDGRRTGTLILPFVIMVIVAGTNLVVSTDQVESLLRWLIWFEMFFAFGLLATQCDEGVERSLARLLPFAAALTWYAKYNTANTLALSVAEKEADLHLSAFFASVTVATGMFHPKVAWRCIFVVVGSYGVLVSGSRAAFLFFPINFIAPLLYYFRRPSVAIFAALVPTALLVVIFLNASLRDATFGLKAASAGRDAVEDAQQSMEGRAALREIGVQMITSRPFGYGYGNTYIIPGARKDAGTNFHNGYMNVGAAMGIPFLLLYASFNAWLVWSLLKGGQASRLFRHLFLAVLVSANLRSITEDFTLFDLGNPICYLIIYMSFLYMNKRRYQPIYAGS